MVRAWFAAACAGVVLLGATGAGAKTITIQETLDPQVLCGGACDPKADALGGFVPLDVTLFPGDNLSAEVTFQDPLSFLEGLNGDVVFSFASTPPVIGGGDDLEFADFDEIFVTVPLNFALSPNGPPLENTPAHGTVYDVVFKNTYFGYAGATSTDPSTAVTIDGFTLSASSVPEPTTWALMFGGLFGLGASLRRFPRSVAPLA